MNEAVDDELLAKYNLIRLPLHVFTSEMKAGRYFEHPDRAMLAKLKSAEDFRGLELAEVRFQTKCTGKGIHLPKFIFSADG